MQDSGPPESGAAKGEVVMIAGEPVSKSYELATQQCKETVASIVKECRRTNRKHYDHDSVTQDVSMDDIFSLERRNTEKGERRSYDPVPASSKRVGVIFENPQFFMDEAIPSEVLQGRVGNCWLISSLCALGNQPDLIAKLCVARDEKIGVYGFVFFRDGEWISEVIDDFLYLSMPDYDSSIIERRLLAEVQKGPGSDDDTTEETYRKLYQVCPCPIWIFQCAALLITSDNSGALYFGNPKIRMRHGFRC